jgi:hypothetical protein
MTEPLWSDERIIDAVVSTGLSYTVAIQVREDYEAALAAKAQELVASYKRESEVEIAWADALAELVEAQECIAELEAEVARLAAERWEPLGDGAYEATFGPIHIITDAGLKKETLVKDADDVMILPNYMRLCRRVQP